MSLAEQQSLRTNQGPSPWTEELTIKLAEEWAVGKSLALIASELNRDFGTIFTPNAIIGKIYRLGLPRRITKFGLRGPLRGRPRYEAEQIAVIEDNSIPQEQRKTLVELEPHDCRWPIGEPRSDLFFFCGGAALDGHSYCAAHCRRAYAPR